MSRRGHRSGHSHGQHETTRPRPRPAPPADGPRVVVADGLPPSCGRCKALGRHVQFCIPCAMVRAGCAEDTPHERLFAADRDEAVASARADPEK